MQYFNRCYFITTQATLPEDWYYYSHLIEAQGLQDNPDHTSHWQEQSPNQSSDNFFIAHNILDWLFSWLRRAQCWDWGWRVSITKCSYCCERSWALSLVYSKVFILQCEAFWAECLTPPKIHMLKSNPLCASICKWRFWEVIGSWRWDPHEWD